MTNTMRSVTAVVITITVAITMTIVAGQGTAQAGTCATTLIPCAAYLKGTTTPPPSCCNPLKDAVTNQKECLCNLYKNPEVLKSYGVNVTQAQNLPTRCKIPSDAPPADFCKGVAPSGSPPSSTSTTPTGGTKGGSAARITGTGFVFGLLMFVTYVVVY